MLAHRPAAIANGDAMTTAALPAPVHRARRLWRPLLLVAGVLVAAVAVRGRLPDPASTWTVLRHAGPAWLTAAVVLQLLSITAFAEQQRHLLAGFGVRISTGVSLAISYARAAIATALPAGSAVSAGYAFRQFRSRGAGEPEAAAVMLLPAVASIAGLALLYGALACTTSPAARILTSAVAVLLVATAVGIRRRRTSTRLVATAVRIRRRSPSAKPETPARTPTGGRLRRTLRETYELTRSVPARRWLTVIALAVLNWLGDLACLIAVLHAVGLDLPVRTVAIGYLVTHLVRQIPATPGGIGVIEASLLIALTTAGAATAPAAAAVLIYRLLTCWSVLPIGLICWTALKP